MGRRMVDIREIEGSGMVMSQQRTREAVNIRLERRLRRKSGGSVPHLQVRQHPAELVNCYRIY